MSPDLSTDDLLALIDDLGDRVTELEDEVRDLRSELDETSDEVRSLRLRVAERDEREYDALSRREKVERLRQHAFDRARDQHGRARLDYNDVRWGLFDGEPSESHCYDLMQWAATGLPDEESVPPGFRFERGSANGSNTSLVVDADTVRQHVPAKSESVGLAAKKRAALEGGE